MRAKSNPRYCLKIPNWAPTLTNKLLNSHWAVANRLKKVDAALIATYAKLQGIPKATERRRVYIEAHGWPRGRRPDPDSMLKSTLDGLVKCGLLVDDSSRWCEISPCSVVTDCEKYCMIWLEDAPQFSS